MPINLGDIKWDAPDPKQVKWDTPQIDASQVQWDEPQGSIPIPNKQYTEPKGDGFLGTLKGIGEGIVHTVPMIAEGFMAIPQSAVSAMANGTSFEQEMQDRARQSQNYLPEDASTRTGTKINAGFDETMRQLLPVAGIGHILPMPGRVVRPKGGPKGPDIPPPKSSVPPSTPPEPGARVMDNIVESQTTGWNEPVRNNGTGNGMDTVVQQTQAAREAAVQATLDQRQRAMEQEVAQRTSLDRNAAERGRQEGAPTGFAEYQEGLRRDAEARRPGNNEPLNMENPYPVDTREFPQVLADAPESRGGLDLSQDTANRMARPLEQDMANPALRPEEAGWEGEGGNTTVQNFSTPNPAKAYWENRVAGRSPGGRQRGAVDMDLFTPGFEKLKMINNGIQLRLRGGFDPIIQAVDRYGKQVGELKLNTDTFEQKPSSNLQAGYVHIDPAHRGKGIAEQMYKFAAEHGDVQADMGHLLPAGKKMWEGFEKRGVANNEWTIPRNQRGAVDIKALNDGLRALKKSLRGDVRWLKDDKGDTAIVFRGNNNPESGATPREGYATFVTDNPHLANSFVRQGMKGDPMEGTLHPFVFKSDVKLVKYKAGETYGGFNKFAFDAKAKALGPNEVLVVRNSTDHGPGEIRDPYRRAGMRADQYAFTDPNVVVPLMEAAKDAHPEPATPSSWKLRRIQNLKEDIKELESKPLTPTDGTNANDPSRYGNFTLTKNHSGEKYVQKFNEYARQKELEDAKAQLAEMQAERKLPKGQRGVLYFGEGKNRRKFPNTPQMREQLTHDLTKYLGEQISESFPYVAKFLQRGDVRQVVHEIVEADKLHDPIQYWMEKLAGTTEKEDPTIGGQLRGGDRLRWGQAKGPHDLYKFNLSPEQVAEFKQFGEAVIQMWKDFSGTKMEKILAKVNEAYETYADLKEKYNVHYDEPPSGIPEVEHAQRMYHYAIEMNYTKAKALENQFIDKYGMGPIHEAPEGLVEQYPPTHWSAIHAVADGVTRHIEDRPIPKGQRGAINFDEASRAFNRTVERVSDAIGKLNPLTPKEQVLANAVGKPFIPRPEEPAAAIAKALAEGKDGPNLFNRFQSGLDHAAEKSNSYAQRYVARALHFAEKQGDYYVNKVVNPVAKAFTVLNKADLISVMKVMNQEKDARARYSPDELATHLSPKAQEAYRLARAALDDVLAKNNEGLVKQGRRPMTAHEAFMTSMWDGQWHVPLYDKTGKKLLWYIKSQTRGEAVKAIQWIKENTDLPTESLAPKYYNENIGRKVPRDVLGAYSDMLQFFKDQPDIADNISDATKQYTEEQGFKFMGHYVHFKDKSGQEGVRGYLGDRPWLSESQNAISGADALMKYLKDAYRWAPTQDGLSMVKEVLGNKDLNAQQPNNMKLARLYTAQYMGVTHNIFKMAENELQKITSSMPGLPNGLAQISSFVHSIKTLTYLSQLSASAGYMIATPLQSFLLGPSWHMKIGGEYNTITTAAKTMADMKGLWGEAVTDIGKEALHYARDNGIIDMNVFHENSGVGDFGPAAAAKKGLGWTISYPEKLARASTFLSFVHHLDEAKTFMEFNADGSTYTNHAGLFQRAEELTNHTLTDFRRSSRPLIVDQAGQLGEIMYTYKSPIFNFYNTMSVFGRDLMKGKPGPFITALGMTALLSGAKGFPGVNEVDGTWRFIKNQIAKWFPHIYPSVRDVDITRFIIKNAQEISANQSFQDAVGGDSHASFLRDAATDGVVSATMGAQMGTRFSANLGDIQNPLGQMAPALQEIKEAISAGKTVFHPTSTNLAEAAWQQLPPAGKGILENNVDSFQSIVQGDKQGMLNPNHLEEAKTAYFRSPTEQRMRYAGLTSLKESNTKHNWYENKQEEARWKVAQEESATKLFDAIKRKDLPDIKRYGKAYYDNYGTDLEGALQASLDGYDKDPRQNAYIRAETTSAILAIKRYLDTAGAKNAN